MMKRNECKYVFVNFYELQGLLNQSAKGIQVCAIDHSW